MTFFPADFDLDAPGAGVLHLVRLDTPDGYAHFMLGTDGVFQDTNGASWVGTQLFRSGDTPISINGSAPEGVLSMSWIQAEGAPSLVDELRDLGSDYVKGREIAFFVQPIDVIEEFYAPRWAPVRFRTGTMQAVSFEIDGPLRRKISLTFESTLIGRNTARGLTYTTTDHSTLVGTPNASLRNVPRDNRTPEKLFG